jgi:DNA-binding response OmpR family regulator
VKYLTALQAAYIAKAIDATELKARVKAIPRNEAVADWMVKIADVRIEIEGKGNVTDKPSLIAIGELKQMYIQNIINEDKILFELRTRGYIESDIQIMLSLLNSNKETVLSGGSKFGLSVSEMFEALKYGFISEDRVRTELLQKNMTLEDANILISTKLAKINAV